MFGLIVICLSTFHIQRSLAQGECTDVRGRLISHGLHYVPGPDTCTLCICDNGQAKVCKAVLCSPPQDCRSFRVGNTCCEFICLDDVVKPIEHTDANNMRMATAGGVSVVLMAAALMMYHYRRQKRRRPARNDDQRSLTSIGVMEPPFHRPYPATVESLARPDDVPCAHGYVNVPRPLTQPIAMPQGCYAPLLQSMHGVDNRDHSNALPHHLLAPSVGFPSAIRLTGSLGAISNRGLLSLLQREREHERPHNVPGFYASQAPHTHASLQHRTIPRISAAIDTAILDAALPPFGRGDRSLHNEIRRSFHKPNETSRQLYTETGRSIPRNLNLASNAELSRMEPSLGQSGPALNARGVANSTNSTGRSRAHSEDSTPPESNPLLKAKPAPAPAQTQPTLPLTVDKPLCVCSYEDAQAPAAEHDDYRSECENCKSAGSSRWVLEEGWVEEETDGTQTLQRRAPPPAPPPPATATLPQPVTKQSRTVMGPPSNWENWFNSIPDSESESEEE